MNKLICFIFGHELQFDEKDRVKITCQRCGVNNLETIKQAIKYYKKRFPPHTGNK